KPWIFAPLASTAAMTTAAPLPRRKRRRQSIFLKILQMREPRFAAVDAVSRRSQDFLQIADDRARLAKRERLDHDRIRFVLNEARAADHFRASPSLEAHRVDE